MEEFENQDRMEIEETTSQQSKSDDSFKKSASNARKVAQPMKKAKRRKVFNAYVIKKSFYDLIREEGARYAADMNSSPELNREGVEENQFINKNDRMTNKFIRLVGKWLSEMIEGDSLSEGVRQNATAMIHVAKKVPREIKKC